ncbi:hypothetical protein [Sphaerisporangium perillae]|nr:hypothetical protein [Sphaerisporangium perillae]
MSSTTRLVDLIRGESFLENAFIKWVLSVAMAPHRTRSRPSISSLS